MGKFSRPAVLARQFLMSQPRSIRFLTTRTTQTLVWLVWGSTLLMDLSTVMAQDKPEEQAKPDPAALLKTFREEFVAITPGKGEFPKSFEMGSMGGDPEEQPRHKVKFDYDFHMARYEVPQDLYEAVMGKNPSVWGGPRNSVEMVSHQDALAFCAKATMLLRQAKLIAADEEIRLPSEAEWEYCCRAGTTTTYSFGEKAQTDGDEGVKASLLDSYGWHTGNAAGNDPPVGALKPNAWGLYDMHGYLWEYVGDGWHKDYKNAPGDGGSWEPNSRELPKVMRGGSWRDPFPLLTSSARWPIPNHAKSDAIGFRCVLAKRK
jgi:formylglycine-generating enzyme required for sulfatase activity